VIAFHGDGGVTFVRQHPHEPEPHSGTRLGVRRQADAIVGNEEGGLFPSPPLLSSSLTFPALAFGKAHFIAFVTSSLTIRPNGAARGGSGIAETNWQGLSDTRFEKSAIILELVESLVDESLSLSVSFSLCSRRTLSPHTFRGLRSPRPAATAIGGTER